jgi:hypothetical protein
MTATSGQAGWARRNSFRVRAKTQFAAMISKCPKAGQRLQRATILVSNHSVALTTPMCRVCSREPLLADAFYHGVRLNALFSNLPSRVGCEPLEINLH